MNHKILSLLGLAARSRNLVSGEFAVEKSVKSGHACMVLAANDASENTKKMYRNMCEYYHVPLYFFSDRSELGHAIGKEFRAAVAVEIRDLQRPFAGNSKIVKLNNGGAIYGKN